MNFNNTVLGIGIDSVEIKRFKDWHTYSLKSLRRIFSQQEIDYCLSCSTKSAERFAARFAAREALLKALNQAFPEIKVPLLTLCSSIEIVHNKNGSPQILFTKKIISTPIHCHASWTHTQEIATSIVITS